MHSSISIAIAAPPSAVFAVARDVARWAELLPHYRSVTIESRKGDRVVARMVALRRFGPLAVPVTWRAEAWPDGTDATHLRLRFRHLRGVTRGMDVTWHIRPLGAGALVTIDHRFDSRVPFLGVELVPPLVDRFFTRHIAGRTLRTFKSLAETSLGDQQGHDIVPS